MVNELLVNVFNSILGVGKPTSRGNYSYHCPFCNHHKPKFEICFDQNSTHFQKYACWVCGNKGTKLTKLSKNLKVPQNIQEEISSLLPKTRQIQEQLNKTSLTLPKEYIPLYKHSSSIIYRHAMVYLRKRGVTLQDIIKYDIGYCETGEYANSIVIPSYDEKGNLNYFTSRSFNNSKLKYKNPDTSRDIIPFEFFINWDQPIILCEGPFDALAIKRNAVPLLGKNITPKLMTKLVESKVKKIYIALDKDAMKKALEFCETLINEGKQVFLIDLEEKDPGEIGFIQFTRLLHNAKPLTFSRLLEKKMQLL
jgi:DNA primase